MMVERRWRRAAHRCWIVLAFLAMTHVRAGGASGPEEPLLPFSSYLGETELLYAGTTAAAVGPNGVVWIATTTESDSFLGALRSPPSQTGHADVVVARIDPAAHTVLSTARLNGSGDEHVRALAIDGAGNAYIAGTTNSTEFPLAAGSSKYGNPFVARLLPDGSDFAWIVTFGSGGANGADSVSGLCVTADGDPVVVGNTYSPTFPLVSALDANFRARAQNAFVTRVRSDGAGLVFSTYLGGYARDCCLAPDGGILVAGGSTSPDFLSRADLALGAAPPGGESFLTEIDPSGIEILRLARFGDAMRIDHIAATTGSIVLEGAPGSSWGQLPPPADSTPAGSVVLLWLDPSTWTPIGDAPVGPSDSAQQYSALTVNALAVGPDGTAWIGGYGWTRHPLTRELDLPVPGAVRPHFGGFQTAYVAAFEPTNFTQTLGTYLGGTSAEALAVDRSGSCWVASYGGLSVHAVQPQPASGSPDSAHLFVAELREGDPTRRPVAVTDPAASAIDARSIRVSWASNDGRAIAYGIDRTEIADGGWMLGWSRVALVPADAREWVDASLPTDRRYQYSVQAVGEGGGSPASPPLDAATPPTLDLSIRRGRARYARARPSRMRHGDVLVLRGKLLRQGSALRGPELREKGLRLKGGDARIDAYEGVPILTIPPVDKAWRVGPGRVLHWRKGRSSLVYSPKRGRFALRVVGVAGPLGWNLESITTATSGHARLHVIVGDDAGSTVPVWRVIQRRRAPHRILGASTP